MMEEEPSRYRRRTGFTVYVEKPLDSQISKDIKQCDDPESISARTRELNPATTRDKRDGEMVEHNSGSEMSGRSGIYREKRKGH